MKDFIKIKCLCHGERTVNINHIQEICNNEHNKSKRARFKVDGEWHETNLKHEELEALISAAQA